MLYALAIAQIAIEFSTFYERNLSFTDHFYVITHLILIGYIIITGWYGWNNSRSIVQENEKDNSHTLNVLQKYSNNLSILILVIDLLILLCYFVIVRNVEKPIDSNIVASAKVEIIWSLIIFAFYFMWDIITKIFDINEDGKKLMINIKRFIRRGFQSLLCFIIILIFILPMKDKVSSSEVIHSDISLLMVFILFRGLKAGIKGSRVSKIIQSIFNISIPIIILIIMIIINNIAHK